MVEDGFITIQTCGKKWTPKLYSNLKSDSSDNLKIMGIEIFMIICMNKQPIHI